MKDLPKDKYGPGSDFQKIKHLPDLVSCGPKFGLVCQKAVQRKEKQQWAIEKPKLDNARKLRSVYFLDSKEKEFKETFKKKRKKKLDIPIEAAMPCKLKTTERSSKHREIDSVSNKIQTSKHALCAKKKVQFVESL